MVRCVSRFSRSLALASHLTRMRPSPAPALCPPPACLRLPPPLAAAFPMQSGSYEEQTGGQSKKRKTKCARPLRRRLVQRARQPRLSTTSSAGATARSHATAGGGAPGGDDREQTCPPSSELDGAWLPAGATSRVPYHMALLPEDAAALGAETKLRVALRCNRAGQHIDDWGPLVSVFPTPEGGEQPGGGDDGGSAAVRATTSGEPAAGESPVLPYCLLRFPGPASPCDAVRTDRLAPTAPQIAPKRVVASLTAFRDKFGRTFPGILQRLEQVDVPPGIKWLVAGGCVVRTLLDPPGAGPQAGFDSNTSDIDVFLYSEDDDQAPAAALAERIFRAVAADGEQWGLSRTSNVINMVRDTTPSHEGGVDAHVQIVLHLFKNAAEVLTGFDVDCCALGFDGRHVLALPRALRALERGYNVADPSHSWLNRASYELRLVKYAFRGFGTSPVDVGGVGHGVGAGVVLLYACRSCAVAGGGWPSEFGAGARAKGRRWVRETGRGRLTKSPACHSISPALRPDVAVPGVTFDQLAVATSSMCSGGNTGDSPGAGQQQGGSPCLIQNAVDAGGALQGLSRLLYLEWVCRQLVPGGGDRFAVLRVFLDNDLTALTKIVIFGSYDLIEGVYDGTGGEGVAASGRAHVNASRSLIVRASGAGEDPSRFGRSAGSDDDGRRRGILFGTMAKPMTHGRRTAAWVAIERSSHPTDIGGYTECLEFGTGPRMRQYYYSQYREQREDIWYRSGTRGRSGQIHMSDEKSKHLSPPSLAVRRRGAAGLGGEDGDAGGYSARQT